MKASPEMSTGELAEQDLHFHEIIWRASGNRVCQRMFSSLHRAITRSLNVTALLREEGAPLSAHEKVYLAIRAGDADAARRQMVEHLQHGESSILKTTRIQAEAALV
jgi:DNA-binding FadR family transcriptional regulator